jgi:NADPH-dependent 2,4-dienoyl-CoA reductase/sulfur reductase-like enzyme
MRIVIIGGDAAGMSAAMQIRRRQPEWEVGVFEKGRHTSYGACGIPYVFSGDVASLDSLVVISPEGFHKKGVDVRTGHEVIAIYPEQQTVEVNPPSGETERHSYDKLLIASGARAILPAWPGRELTGVTPVKTLADAQHLSSLLQHQPRRAVIVGAGYIGLEMAEGLRKQGLEVTVLEKLPGVMGNLHPEIHSQVTTALEQAGVALHLGVTVTGFQGEEGQLRSVTTDQGEFAADIAIISLGVRPNVDFLAGSGVVLGASGAIAVNAYQQTSDTHIYAAGDCAEAYHRVLQEPAYIPLALTANRQGRVAGTHICGGQEAFPGIVGSAVTKVFELVVARTGIDAASAERAGIPYRLAEAKAPAKAHYYQGHGEVWVQLMYHAESHVLLGALMAGDDPSLGKRCDIVATAISGGMTVLELSDLDLCYAPPFAPVWDPVLQAANKARFELV